MHFYITGDTHRDFDRIKKFCQENITTKEDVMIILGDAGINYCLNFRDRELKKELADLDITLFCIHGNHEERPWKIEGYVEAEWNDGIVYMEKEFPNLLFAKDGEIYNLNGKKVLVIGGAYSVDKHYRQNVGLPWFKTEQPDDRIKDAVEAQLDKVNWTVDIVLSHTVPIDAEPKWAFIPGLDQSRVDKSTENWLQYIRDHLTFTKWYAGHFHVNSVEEGIQILYKDYMELE